MERTSSTPRRFGWHMRFVGAYLAVVGILLGGVLAYNLVHVWQVIFPAN